MKWYIEFPILYAVVVVVFFLVTPYRHEEVGLGIVVSVIFGFILTLAVYWGYKMAKEPKKK